MVNLSRCITAADCIMHHVEVDSSENPAPYYYLFVACSYWHGVGRTCYVLCVSSLALFND